MHYATKRVPPKWYRYIFVVYAFWCIEVLLWYKFSQYTFCRGILYVLLRYTFCWYRYTFCRVNVLSQLCFVEVCVFHFTFCCTYTLLRSPFVGFCANAFGRRRVLELQNIEINCRCPLPYFWCKPILLASVGGKEY